MDGRCGAHHAHFRVTCDLADGHVRTADDWHEARSTETRETVTDGWTMKAEQSETARGAPAFFEIPPAGTVR